MINPTANRKNFEHLPQHEQDRWAQVLRTLDACRIGCRCELVGGREFYITAGYGLATARFWLDALGIDYDGKPQSPSY